MRMCVCAATRSRQKPSIKRETMPGTDTVSYDHFDLRHYDEEPLTLDEASDRAAKMRKQQPEKIHRVAAANVEGDRFHVDSLSPLELYAEFLCRLSARWARMQEKRLGRHG